VREALRINVNGEMLLLREVTQRLGIHKNTLLWRLKNWKEEDVLKPPGQLHQNRRHGVMINAIKEYLKNNPKEAKYFAKKYKWKD
jgi:sugar diacid utilization regulator